jgi:sugar (pentulose or hexulose) kinase
MLAVEMGEADLLHVIGTTQVLMRKVARPEPSALRLVRRLGIGDDFVHVTHNPVGGSALEWLRQLCFPELKSDEFYDREIPAAANRKTAVNLDPPFLGGDRLEIAPATATFSQLTLWSQREDLLAALVAAMRRGHQTAMKALGISTPVRRAFITGGAAASVQGLLPEYAQLDVRLFEHGSLLGVARLFDR